MNGTVMKKDIPSVGVFSEQPKRCNESFSTYFDSLEIMEKFLMRQSRHEGDGIYAFKPQPDRYTCFFFKVRRSL